MRRPILIVVACLALCLMAPAAASAATNITVVSGGGTVNNSGAPNFTPTGADSQIGVDLINGQLAANTNVILNTSPDNGQPGTIAINAAISGGSGTGNLTLNADSTVTQGSSMGANGVSITTPGAVSLGTLATGSLTVSAAGGVVQTGAATVPGTSSFAANTTHDAILTNAGNDFGTVITGGTVADLSIVDANALVLGTLSTNGVLDVTTGGNLTQSGPVTPSGATDIDVGAANDLTLTNASNHFPTISIAHARNVQVADSNHISFDASTIAGNLSISASGPITQTAAISASGTTTFTVGAANDVTLNNASNDWGTVGVTSARNVSLTDASGLVLGASTVSGNLVATATNALTQSGAAAVTGTTSASGSPVTLNQPANAFTGNVSITSSGSGAATVVDADDLGLTNSTSGGSLSTVAGDDLTLPAGATVAATGALSLVADNLNPSPPAIGSGGTTVGSGAALTGAGAIRLYGARRSDNSIDPTATFNGATFSPGPLFTPSPREQWGAYSPGGTATAPFTFFYKDSDASNPTAAIASPANGATYAQGQVESASYACSDPGGSIASCTGPVPSGSPIDTSTPGQKTFTVQAVDGSGNRGSATVTYTVTPAPAPQGQDPKCAKLRSKLGRQKARLAQAVDGKRSHIQGNVADTNRRLRRLGC